MDTFNPIIASNINPILSGNSITIFLEDAARDGFINLGSAGNAVTYNRSIIFDGQAYEDTRAYLVNGQGGADTITTAAGDDVVYGGSGADTISTGKGQDKLYGGSGNDTLYAGSGDDRLEGGSGHDVLDGGTGMDVLVGGIGNDTMTGGAETDLFTINLTSGIDLITDFTRGKDLIVPGGDIRAFMPDTYRGALDVAAILYNVDAAGVWSGRSLTSSPTGPALIFDAGTQMLSFDADDLLGSGAAVDLVKLTGVTALSASDFWVPAPF